MSKHTPGPWLLRCAGQFTEGEPGHEETHDYPAHVVVLDRTEEGLKRTRFVAECSGAGLPNDDNARLIAAAPELLEALKLVWSMFDDGRIVRNIANDHNPDWALKMLTFARELQAISAAIAKAEGLSPENAEVSPEPLPPAGSVAPQDDLFSGEDQ